MADIKKVVWSREASNRLSKIKEYVLDEWSEDEFISLLKRLKAFENRVLFFPKLYPASQKVPELRKAVISKHHSVIYELSESTIYIITILENRQDNA